MPVYGLPNAVAHTAPDTPPDTASNAPTDAAANAPPDQLPDAFSYAVSHAPPDQLPYAVSDSLPDSLPDAARSSGLRDERLRQVDTVLEDVRRRNAVTNEIHRGGAGARRQGVRQLSPGAGLQPGGVHVRRAKLQRFRAIWRVFGVVRQQRRQAPHAHIAGQAVHGCDAI